MRFAVVVGLFAFILGASFFIAGRNMVIELVQKPMGESFLLIFAIILFGLGIEWYITKIRSKM